MHAIFNMSFAYHGRWDRGSSGNLAGHRTTPENAMITVLSVPRSLSIGQTITVAKLLWDRLPACQFSHDRLEAYPTYCLGGAK
jgi:hypothetical protein